MINHENTELLDELIVGRVKPHIYAFTTNTIPNYLKVGDTYRPVMVRLHEWMQYFPMLRKEFEDLAIIGDDIFFRDYSVHQYLEQDLGKHRLERKEFPREYYSNEFFADVQPGQVSDAISDIKENYEQNTGKYKYYDATRQLPKTFTYASSGMWDVRPNQQVTIDNFVSAVDSGHTNLLMYAVMRFGKSFTSLCCAKAKGYKLVLVVSAKADVREEWKKTVQSAENFNKDYIFISSDDLVGDESIIKATLAAGKGAVVFLTLQDLQGDDIKDKHKEVFGNQIDLLIVDETHYGARAESYGKILRSINYEKDVKEEHSDDDFIEADVAEEQLKSLDVKITLHLSGTPYRILMGSEFSKEDIIAFYQFSDIVKDKEEWDKAHLLDDTHDVKEWENPYYGFPQMVRFAFVPSKSALALLDSLKSGGTTYAFSAFLKPQSIKKDTEHSLHKKFVYESEVLELFEAIDGSKEDEGLLSFLDYDKIKDGKMCEHIVCVLPYCASCDALQQLLEDNASKFKNLQNYTIINISGVDRPNEYRDIKAVKAKIKQCACEGKKTLTLTVNRMLTGSTVEQWDTMIFLKDTASPQEYDQAIFRLQNQYIREYIREDGDTIKFNMKPQTLLVDFDPHRMFVMQEQKSQIYNANTDASGNEHLKDRIADELRISPIITLNKNRIEQVEATDILAAISEYSSSRGVLDETKDIPVDMTLLDLDAIKAEIERQAELGSRQGLSVEAHHGKGTDMDSDDDDNGNGSDDNGSDSGDDSGIDSDSTSGTDSETEDDIKKLENKFRTYYSRILFFAFLTKDNVVSLNDIIRRIDNGENARIASNLCLYKNILELMRRHMNIFILRQLDYKIQNINTLAHDETVEPMQRATVAIRKFGRISDSEITTPEKVASNIINLIPDDCFYALRDGENNRILDIASKMGEFAVAILKRCETLGIALDEVKDKILSIPTSSIAYEFTRKVYDVLGLDLSAIAEQFNSYELLKIKKLKEDGSEGDKLDYEKIKNLLSQKKDYADISLDDDISGITEVNKVNFNAVVGNPPYQETINNDTDNQSLSKQLFPQFIMMSEEITEKYVSLITPARWFAGDAQDKSFVKLRNYIKGNNHIQSLYYFPDAREIFSNVEIKGGLQYYLSANDFSGDLDFYSIHNGKSSYVKRSLFFEDMDIVISDVKAIPILKKVITGDFKPLTHITTGRNAFGIIGKPYVIDSISKSVPFAGSVPLRCKANTIRWINPERVTKNREIFESYKVFISKSAGNPNSDTRVIGYPYVGEPNSACTDSLIPIGKFDNNEEAENLAKYLKTRFLRFLVQQVKNSQNVTQIVYRFVPMQNFTNQSDIDWNTTIKEIEKQLYSKYSFTDDEISHVESFISEVE